MPITLKQINVLDSDQIKIDIVNYNFDQLVANGGGPRGPQGDIGTDGPQGTTGPQGPQGLIGITGDEGTVSKINDNYWNRVEAISGAIDAITLLPIHIPSDQFAPVINIGYLDTDPDYKSKQELVEGKTPYQWVINRKTYMSSNLRFKNRQISNNWYDFKLEKIVNIDQLTMGFLKYTTQDSNISNITSYKTIFKTSDSENVFNISPLGAEFNVSTEFNLPVDIKQKLIIENSNPEVNSVAISENADGLIKFKRVNELQGTVPFGTIVSIAPYIFNEENFIIGEEINGFPGSPIEITVGKGLGVYEGWYLCNGMEWTNGEDNYQIPMIGKFNYEIEDNSFSKLPNSQGVAITNNTNNHIIGGSSISTLSIFNENVSTGSKTYSVIGTVSMGDSLTNLDCNLNPDTGIEFTVKRLLQIIYLGRNDLYWFDKGIGQDPPIQLTFNLNDENITPSKLDKYPYILDTIIDQPEDASYSKTYTVSTPIGYHWSTIPPIESITGFPAYASIPVGGITAGPGDRPTTINILINVSLHPASISIVNLGIDTTEFISVSTVNITLVRKNPVNVVVGIPGNQTSSYLYLINLYSCIGTNMTILGTRVINNAEMLTVDSWYSYTDALDFSYKIKVIEFQGSSEIFPDNNILNSTKKTSIGGLPTCPSPQPCITFRKAYQMGPSVYIYEDPFVLNPKGGVIIFEVASLGVPDKMEIIHNGVKKSTSGMLADGNYGPFDNVYGQSATSYPSVAQTSNINQFIGSSAYKNISTIPSRRDELYTDTGFSMELSIAEIGIKYDQFVWWKYTTSDYNVNRNVTVRLTGPSVPVGADYSRTIINRVCPVIQTVSLPAVIDTTNIVYNFETGYTFQLEYLSSVGFSFDTCPINNITQPSSGGGIIKVLESTLSDRNQKLVMSVNLSELPMSGYLTNIEYSINVNLFLETVPIGNQRWTTRNTGITTYRDGTVIPEHTGTSAEWANLKVGRWCYANSTDSNKKDIGKLYNWYAVAGIHAQESTSPTAEQIAARKTFAPVGYHVPTATEWNTLINGLGGPGGTSGSAITSAYWKIRENVSSDMGEKGWATGVPIGVNINSSGFSIKYRRWRDETGEISSTKSPTVEVGSSFWSLTEYNTTDAYAREIGTYDEGGPFAGAQEKTLKKSRGLSVRLVKDINTGVTCPVTLPSIETHNPSLITGTTSTTAITGNIFSDGGGQITGRGICWNLGSLGVDPTIDLTTKTSDGTGPGTFKSTITGLTDNVSYIMRAYATNAAGTTYSNKVEMRRYAPFTSFELIEILGNIGGGIVTSLGLITEGQNLGNYKRYIGARTGYTYGIKSFDSYTVITSETSTNVTPGSTLPQFSPITTNTVQGVAGVAFLGGTGWEAFNTANFRSAIDTYWNIANVSIGKSYKATVSIESYTPLVKYTGTKTQQNMNNVKVYTSKLSEDGYFVQPILVGTTVRMEAIIKSGSAIISSFDKSYIASKSYANLSSYWSNDASKIDWVAHAAAPANKISGYGFERKIVEGINSHFYFITTSLNGTATDQITVSVTFSVSKLPPA